MFSEFTERDKAQIIAHGLSIEQAERQMENFHAGFPPLAVVRAATVGDGIMRVGEQEAEKYRERYRTAGRDVVKFTPASGAATRMFRDLFAFAESGTASGGAEKTVRNIDKFAFRERLEPFADDREAAQSVLDYGAKLPKGLILFHKYPEGARTAAEEHLREGAEYGVSRFHFTVSPEHEAGFREVLPAERVTFSRQEPCTDTLAAAPDGQPFRGSDGRLLFRPAGHGALLENLNAIEADLIYIKNIDNVTTDARRADTTAAKELLGGIALALQEQIFAFLNGDSCLCHAVSMREFIEKELCYKLPLGATENDMRDILNRPLRVCAMVRNEGEPGGGPFWVQNTDGSVALQIGESAQIADKEIFRQGTHFNPVDIVCAVRGAHGWKFDLRRYTDPSAGFIAEKSKDGRTLLAQELPGLWNGAMARWNTVFVEVPATTFTPVKEVNDLLRKEHQNG